MQTTRRNFLKTSALTGSTLLLNPLIFLRQDELDTFIKDFMDYNHIPGLAACIIKNKEIVWIKGYGWANIEKKIPMSPQNTVQNIGSVSKTFTATAVMQLWEKGKFKLDDNVNDYLPFRVENPRFPGETITFRQLLTHRSSIKDGSSYGESYKCGDPSVSLGEWLKEYFTPGGKYYDKNGNFHTWNPGKTGTLPSRPRAYTNVGFGLLGYLAETISGTNFSEYCKKNIFEPLDMTHTAWHLKDLDTSKHAVPYTYIPAGSSRRILRQNGRTQKRSEKGEFVPHCLYSFYNYPDGLIRTSIEQIAYYISAYLNMGAYKNRRILQEQTVRTMLSKDHFGRGLCWFNYNREGGKTFWGHGGGDPGINTLVEFSPSDGVGVIAFVNTDNGRLNHIRGKLLEKSAKL